VHQEYTNPPYGGELSWGLPHLTYIFRKLPSSW